MNRNQLTLLVVLGLAVGGLALLVTRRDTASFQSSAPQLGQKLLPAFPLNEVRQIVIHQSTNELVLSRAEEDWTVQNRHGYPAKFSTVGDFLRKIWELKAVRTEQVGPSQLARLELLNPAQGAGSGTLVEFKDQAGKVVASVLLGKQHLRKSETPSPAGGSESFPDGRYLLVPDGSKNVAVVTETFSEVDPKPDRWLDKDFFKVEKLKSISVTQTNATNSWKLVREVENGELKFSEANPGEQLDTGKSSPLGNVFSFPSFNDVAAPQTPPSETGLDHPILARIETFDGFGYDVKIGNKTAEDNYYFRVAVSADLPRERTPGKDEKPEDRERLDKEFKDSQVKLEEKLKQEKAFENWTYLVSKWTVDPLLKERNDLLAEKTDEKKPDASEPPTEVKPLILN